MKLTSIHNDKVKYWSNLKNKKFRDQEKCFLIEGEHLINEAEKIGLVKETISIDDEASDYLVTKEIMSKISDQKSISKKVAVAKFIPEKDVSGNIIILDNLQDPGNLGTIIRSAVAFNFETIILGDTSVDLYNPKVVRATEGMLFHTNVLRKNLEEYIPKLKSMRYKIIGADVINSSNINSVSKEKVAIVIGSEGSGISKNVKDLCDGFINIKMNEKVESLNAGVAASIIMYEVDNGNI